MSIRGLSSGGLVLALIAVFCSPSGWACATKDLAKCMYADGKFAPFEVEFTTETSAGGLNVDVGISQRLEKGGFGGQWKFRTKITGFLYGLYGSVTDYSEFTILPDNHYRTKNFSRKAKIYGMFPIAPTSFKQKFEWDGRDRGRVKSKYKGDWYRYAVDGTVLDQALLPLQMRADLMNEGPDLGVKVYKATSKKHVDDDFMVRFLREAELSTPMGTVPTVIYELLKGQHKERMDNVEPGHDINEIAALLDQLIVLRKTRQSRSRDEQMATVGAQLNTLLNVDQSTIVSISEDEARSVSKNSVADKDDDKGSVVSKASEIEEGNARVFFWLSKDHAYLPVKMLAVIDSNAWSKVMIDKLKVDNRKVSRL